MITVSTMSEMEARLAEHALKQAQLPPLAPYEVYLRGMLFASRVGEVAARPAPQDPGHSVRADVPPPVDPGLSLEGRTITLLRQFDDTTRPDEFSGIQYAEWFADLLEEWQVRK